MNSREELIKEAYRLAITDRISSEPVVALLTRLAGALEDTEKRAYPDVMNTGSGFGVIPPGPGSPRKETIRRPDPTPTDEAWDRTMDDYRVAGWDGDPNEWERMFWEAGFRQGVAALRAAGGVQ